VGNDYENIQRIYEEGYRGLSMQPLVNPKYQSIHAAPGYSIRRGTLPYPGKEDAYELGVAGNYQVGTAVAVDEEKPTDVEKAEIINLDVLKIVEEFIKEAEEDGKPYTVIQLAKLKEHIISLSQ
jgi:hypothetical protein